MYTLVLYWFIILVMLMSEKKLANTSSRTEYSDFEDIGKVTGDQIQFDLAYQVYNKETQQPAPEIDETYIMPKVELVTFNSFTGRETVEVITHAVDQCNL